MTDLWTCEPTTIAYDWEVTVSSAVPAAEVPHDDRLVFVPTLTISTSKEVLQCLDTIASGLKEFVAREFFTVGEVKAVAFQSAEGTLHVWTVVEHWEEKTAERIYELELAVMDRFDGLRFDFYVVPAEGSEIESLLPLESAYLIRRSDAEHL